MSDNKYIIDKDSLTGIADAVRDKLGAGEATTDSQTGDIIYPEGKGYYLEEVTIAKWEKSETTDTWDGTGTSYVTRANVTEEQLLRVCNGVRPVYVKIDVVLTSTSNDGISVENSLTNWSTSNHIVTLPTSGRFFCRYAYYHSSYYSGRYFQKTIPAITFSFLDENQKIIIPENASKIVDESYNRNLLQESVEMPIPFSIDDIQDKITNYLGGKSNLIYRFHINPQSNENGTSFLGTPLSEMNVLDYGVTSVSQIKFMLIYGYNTSSSFTWYPSSSMSYTMIINGKPFYAADSGNVYWPNYTSDNRYSSYKLQLCPSKLSSWPLGIMRGTTSSYKGEDSLQYPKIVFMVLDLEATE